MEQDKTLFTTGKSMRRTDSARRLTLTVNSARSSSNSDAARAKGSVLGMPIYLDKLVRSSIDILEDAMLKKNDRGAIELSRQEVMICIRALSSYLDPQVEDMTSRVHGLPDDVRQYLLREFVDESSLPIMRSFSIHTGTPPSISPVDNESGTLKPSDLAEEQEVEEIAEFQVHFDEEQEQLLRDFKLIHQRSGTIETGESQYEADFKFTLGYMVDSVDTKIQSQLLMTIDEWEFDIFLFSKHLKHDLLPTLAMAIFEKHNFLTTFKISEKTLLAYMEYLSKSYLNNPYHNSIHGADVGQVMNHFLTRGKLLMYTSMLTRFACIFAAFAHDVGHPGLTNAFLIETGHALAIRYNDVSPLENMHASRAFEILKRPECNILEHMDAKNKKEFRATVINMILATDNAEHNRVVSNLKQTTQTLSLEDCSDGSDSGLMVSDHEQNCILAAAVHAADISSSGKPWQTYKQWTQRLCVEFRNQGDLEKARGLTVLPFMDRNANLPISGFQSGFIEAIVLPLYQALADVPDIRISHCLRYLDSNLRKWEQLSRMSQTTSAGSEDQS